jgi:general secretion pathway protein D
MILKSVMGKHMMKQKMVAAVVGFAVLMSGQAPVAPPARPAATAPQTPAPAKKPAMGNVNLDNVSLTAVIDQMARLLKLNIMVDPAVKGNVTMNTYGETADIDPRNLLEMILRINGYALIQDGELFRVIPVKLVKSMPMHPEINQKNIPEDDQTILNMVFLKYVSVEELSKVLKEFAGENSDMISYVPANLLFLLDSRRNMRRTMELIQQFDSDAFANQRVRLFEVTNAKPSDLVKDLDNVMKSISLDAKTSTVHFLPIDRINTLIAVAPNPGVFDTVGDWLKKLDVPVKVTAGNVETHVYRVYYGRAECLAQALNQLFNPGIGVNGAGGFLNNAANGYGNTAAGGYGNNGGYGAAGVGGGGGGLGGGLGGGANAGGYGNQNSFNSGFGGGGGCSANGLSGGGGGYGGYNAAQAYGTPAFGGYAAQTATNLTGQPLAAAATAAGAAATTPAVPAVIPPRIIANPLDNKLIIQADAQQYQSILKLLKELDVPPRQILLEAKIYSVTLSDSFTSNITAQLAQAGTSPLQLLGNLSSGAVFTAGAMVGQSRQLLLALQASESRTYTKLLSEPSLIATDSIPATITVGTQVPVSTGSTTIPSAGGVVTSSSVSSENTGITLQVNARINSSGVVTLVINQEISAVSPGASNASGTAFTQQVVQTQITLMDGDTIAIGGLIDENYTNNITGIPGLVRLPFIGWLFGNKSVTKERDELIMFFTPHVIFDETQLIEASDQLKSEVKILKRDIRRL